MPTTVQVLNVFLASPDDLAPERSAAEDIVRNINKLLLDFGWQIALFRWEDSSPSYGRPQSIINKAVDDCALFIGVLWEKWGQPTGDYTSGFEEEYERALARRKKGPVPEIWLVFKDIDPSKLKDPGTQLSKVLSFHDKQRSLNEVLYKGIVGVDDWKEKLQNWLWYHVVRLAEVTTTAAQPQTPSSSPEVTSQAAAAQPAEKPGAESEVPGQLVRLVSSLTEVINSGDLEFPRSEDNRLDDFDIARMALLSSTWMSQRQTGETLGTHEINLLFKHRKRLEATLAETDQLFRTIVADTGDVAPGWFWFGDTTQDGLRERLLWLANEDSSDQIRARAIDLLRLARIELPRDSWPRLPFTDSSEMVRSKVYKYLGAIGDESTAASLAAFASREDAAGNLAAIEARLSILLRTNPAVAFSELVRSERYVSDETIKKLQGVAADIGDVALLDGVDSQWDQVRKFSIAELTKRGRLPKELAVTLTKDPDVMIRELAFLELARQATPLDFDEVKKSLSGEDAKTKSLVSLGALLGGGAPKGADAESVILAFYRAHNPEIAIGAVQWFGVDGALAYKSLATDHYAAIRDVLRADLATEFARVRQQSIEVFNEKYGLETAAKIVDEFGKYEDFIKSRFVAAGLSGIAVNGEPSDIRFGRQYVKSERDYVKLPAVRIVSRFGTADDVPILLDLAKNSWGDVRDEAGLAALRLSRQPFEVARELTLSSQQKMVQAGFDWLYEQDSNEVRTLFEELLEGESALDREKSLYFFSRKLNPKEIGAILEQQFHKETYYYNVVTWLDRLLYAPEPLREFFAGLLRRAAVGKTP